MEKGTGESWAGFGGGTALAARRVPGMIGRYSTTATQTADRRAVQDSAPVCPMSAPARAELKKALYLTGAIVSAGGQVDTYTVLDRLRKAGVGAG